MKLQVPLFAAVFTLSACVGGTTGGAISDSEVDAIKTARSSLTTADEFATTGVTHVRLAWGLLAWAGKGVRPTGTDWSGGLTIPDGTAKLDMTTFFEPGDAPVDGAAANEVKWNSHTYPHFDGIIATLTPASATGSLVINTASFKQEIPLADLTSGKELRYPVDAAGHEFSISALADEDASCSGFVVGFVRPEGDVTHFKGLRLSNLGDRLGKLRFDVTGSDVSAEVVDEAGTVLESATGTLDATAKTFSITLAKSIVTGLYVDPSYSSRGSFQATVRCQ